MTTACGKGMTRPQAWAAARRGDLAGLTCAQQCQLCVRMHALCWYNNHPLCVVALVYPFCLRAHAFRARTMIVAAPLVALQLHPPPFASARLCLVDGNGCLVVLGMHAVLALCVCCSDNVKSTSARLPWAMHSTFAVYPSKRAAVGTVSLDANRIHV